MRIAPFARLSRPLRWAARVLSVLVVLAVVLAGAATWTVRRSFPQLSGEIRLPGLAAPVTVHRDGYGIPHIYADAAADLLKAQGYVHAQDRFWEMDFRRKTTAGRLSEVFGASTLEVDKVVRTLGWRRTAEAELPLLLPETRQALADYAAGVNAWMVQHDGFAARSLEYGVLKLTNGGYEPEPWTPADSLAWLKAMAWDLRSNMESELDRALVAARLPAERAAQLHPGYPFDRHATIVTAAPAEEPKGGRPVEAAAAAEALDQVAALVDAVPSLFGTAGGDPAGIGSNSWVVGGAHTATGKPLLANDPHLGPRMPSIWYQAGLHCRTKSAACPYDVAGYTFAGLPGVVIGHNDKIAWGFTNLGPDVTDLYLERVKGDTVEVEGEWKPVQTRTEQIKVAGSEPVELKVRTTGHGPIISGVLGDAREAVPGAAARLGEKAEGLEVALRWTALDPGRTADAILLMNRAEDFEQFRKGAASFEAPAQNLIYADTAGNIGYQAPGKIPVRSAGDGTMPVPGWTGEHEWTGFIPFEKLPSVYNPPEGYIVTANNAVVRPSEELFLTSDWSHGYRSQRIVERIEEETAKGKVTSETMRALLMDDRNNLAPVLVPHLLRLGAPNGTLKGWDFGQGRDSAGAAYFNAVWKHLLARVFEDELTGPTRPGGGDRWYEVVRALLDRPEDPFWDDVRTKGTAERRDDMLKAAMADADAELRERLGGDPAEWAWGDLHTLDLTHETFGTSGIAPVEWLFNRGPLRTAGGKDTVNATGWDATEGYQVNWVPSMRMVVDLADLDRSEWINLTGASGHAFHANYDDQAELWADGRLTPMRFTEPAVRQAAENTLTLTP
ncbi:penicillin acylase family protein [Planomonospora parontospora]|uniref:penicillin acylase family protein n=1 Tax=Planomonospora parontospora TaxID=58119 RepID=UPI0016709F7B|nr:penicillin acylase family protein [Planomonospora parontospora]GGL03245.1 penicillin amidase [Planomonospora parontospora subsp. antibiotica]GII13341.1 penicillin amidase [Planomonospora parontospora subsp. antibiotica]